MILGCGSGGGLDSFSEEDIERLKREVGQLEARRGAEAALACFFRFFREWLSTTSPDADAFVSVSKEGNAVGANQASVLRGGEPAEDASVAEDSSRLYAGIVERIGRFAGPLSHDLLPVLRSPGQTVLEVAAGAAPWGRALCGDDPDTTVTALDLPDVLSVTRAAVDAAGFTDRFGFVAGDVFEVEAIEPADLVLVPGFCRLLGEDQNRDLMARLAGWCRPGGRIGVIDAVSTPASRAAGLAGYELGLLTRTARGRCWSLDHYARWLTDAGFAHIELTPTARPELSLVTARRDPT